MKEINEMKRYAKDLGFECVILRNNHIKFIGHEQVRVTSSSPSDYRTLDKVKKDLKLIAAGKTNKFCHKARNLN